ncbi:hypothetical protein RDI58_000052 [Solanum bulbocastanum]|uniref:Uncharacterized protein n=1 Tax=Solanum bulbocastanum TaxID=147425 RepID=A0AAN8UBF1_SOLBU
MGFILRLLLLHGLVVTAGFFKKSSTSVVCCCCEWFREFAAASQLMASGASLIFGLLTGGVDYFYAFGYAKPPVSSIYLLVSTLLVVTVGLGEQHCIVYSIKVDVFLNIGVGIFYIGEGNDMPARKSMDEKMIVPYITFSTVGTDSLFVPWYTNLLPFHEDTLSAILGYSTFIRICYMALNLHKSTVVLNSFEELDQPFNHDQTNDLDWKAKGSSCVASYNASLQIQ